MEVEATMTDQVAMAEVGVGLVCSVVSDAIIGRGFGCLGVVLTLTNLISFHLAWFASLALIRCSFCFTHCR